MVINPRITFLSQKRRESAHKSWEKEGAGFEGLVVDLADGGDREDPLKVHGK